MAEPTREQYASIAIIGRMSDAHKRAVASIANANALRSLGAQYRAAAPAGDGPLFDRFDAHLASMSAADFASFQAVIAPFLQPLLQSS